MNCLFLPSKGIRNDLLYILVAVSLELAVYRYADLVNNVFSSLKLRLKVMNRKVEHFNFKLHEHLARKTLHILKKVGHCIF